MRFKLIFLSLILLSSLCFNGLNQLKAETNQKSVSSFKNSDYQIRVLHDDNFWWIEVYNEQGDKVLEYIDPDQ